MRIRGSANTTAALLTADKLTTRHIIRRRSLSWALIYCLAARRGGDSARSMLAISLIQQIYPKFSYYFSRFLRDRIRSNVFCSLLKAVSIWQKAHESGYRCYWVAYRNECYFKKLLPCYSFASQLRCSLEIKLYFTMARRRNHNLQTSKLTKRDFLGMSGSVPNFTSASSWITDACLLSCFTSRRVRRYNFSMQSIIYELYRVHWWNCYLHSTPRWSF